MRARLTAAGLSFAMLAALGATIPAQAAEHLVKIREIMSGIAGNPEVQFVELQNPVASEYPRAGSYVRVYGASGAIIQTFTLSANTPGDQAYTLFATSAAKDYFGVTPDVTIDPVIPAAGGALCFKTYDCVSWGNFVGEASLPVGSGGSGPPFNPTAGLPTGQSAERKISAGNPARLEAGDDTKNSAADFQLASPSPTNNAGQTPSGVPSFSAATYQTTEGPGTATITAVRALTTQARSVDYLTVNGTAATGQDYTSVSGTLNFAVGDGSESFDVPILDDGVTDGEEQFTVQLKDGASVVATATVVICGDLPSAPHSVTATAAGTSQINVAWQAPACAGDSPVTSYKIYGGTNQSSLPEIGSVSGTTFQHTGLTENTTYYYKVSAVNGVGGGAQSALVQAKTAANDTRAPAVRIDTPPNTVIVAGTPKVTGTADDDVGVATITAVAYDVRFMNPRPLAVTCTNCGTPLASFSVNVAGLLPGGYYIVVNARDVYNKPGGAQVFVIALSP